MNKRFSTLVLSLIHIFVTIPFVFEGRPKIVKALRGVRNMAQNVDSLLVINNERLRNFADMPVPQANRKADETLTIAAKSIAEIVTTDLEQNVDFADVDKMCIRDSLCPAPVYHLACQGGDDCS